MGGGYPSCMVNVVGQTTSLGMDLTQFQCQRIQYAVGVSTGLQLDTSGQCPPPNTVILYPSNDCSGDPILYPLTADNQSSIIWAPNAVNSLYTTNG